MNKELEQKLRTVLDIKPIINYIKRHNFKTGGACDKIAEIIGKQLEEAGFIESPYMDLVESNTYDYVYEREVTNENNIPHRIINIFDKELKYFLGTVDLPYNLYEQYNDKHNNVRYRWTILDNYKNMTNENFKINIIDEPITIIEMYNRKFTFM